MRRVLFTTSATVAGVVLLLSLKPHQQAVPATPAPAPAGGTGDGAASLADGTYRGQSVDTRYGPVQVEITTSGGRITDVHVLRAPSANGRDREIAARALPRLTRETLAAGNAQIDAVSGATYTSEGYTSSLQSALDSAHG